ncbi:MAG: hypothetical protein ABJG68_16505 [Crocinitomicaceae bacterium]
MRHFLLGLACFLFYPVIGQEPYKNNQTYTYDQLQEVYSGLVKKEPRHCKLVQFGRSDYGKNVSLFMIEKNGGFTSKSFQKKSVLLINNAIHPGEPCGVDASVQLAKTILADTSLIPENVVIGIIPMYNVGGAHNRTCCSRANQNGPEEYGFRGNAKNLDLNRDFIKCDSKNTQAFYKIFHFLNPHVFIDTHTSDGADYQHVMTLITSQIDKMHPWLKEYTESKLNPHLYEEMAKQNFDMVPYVHHMSQTPDNGIFDYLETPRYSTGYTNLFNCISYVSEAHMLKTYEQRVEATLALLNITVNYMDANSTELIQLKKKADLSNGQAEYFPLNWKLDTTQHKMIPFKGYTAEWTKSELTGAERLSYNQSKPWEKDIAYYNSYTAIDSIKKPAYYIIPQAWTEVIIRLQMNNVQLDRLTKDLELEVETYFIDDYSTVPNPYEGHYLHRTVELSKKTQTMHYIKGDYAVSCRDIKARFIVETLEPKAADSYFSWNFFDAILQQKEWFSSYVFEEKAKAILENDPNLKAEFEAKKKEDGDFAKDPFMQLYYIYKRSDNYERTHNQYPVTRLMTELNQDQISPAAKLIGG